MRSFSLVISFIFYLLLTIVTVHGIVDVTYEESDERDDVVFLSTVEFALYRCSDRQDIDISGFAVYNEDEMVVFSLKVFGEIRNTSIHQYSFHVELSYLYTNNPDLTIGYEDGASKLLYMENMTEIDLTHLTEISGGTLNISVPIEYFLDQDIVEIQVWTYESDPFSGNFYADSNLPIEIFAEDENPFTSDWKIALFILVIALLALYFIFGKRWIRKIKRKIAKKCPRCNVRFGRKQRSCTYCGEELS